MVDLREFRAQLPAHFKPDLFIWIDQHDWNLPIYFDALDCPSVAIFGDTHLHLRQDPNVWLSYAREFDVVFLTFTKNHLELFRQAGCRTVFWSPPACDPQVHCKMPAEKVYPVSFVGSTSSLHTERVGLLKCLLDKGVDLHVDSKILHEMSLIYSRSKVVFNKSLADDLNMRVFEAMATGSFLLTNRLPRESGLEELFTDGQHLALYNDNNVLERIRYWLAKQ